MQPEQWARRRQDTAPVMAGVVAGEPWAIGALFEVAEGPVRGIILHRLQDASIWLPSDRLEDLVRDLLLELIQLAPGWRADGERPRGTGLGRG